MRLVILGGTGMLGHALWEMIASQIPETYTTIRKGRKDYGCDDLYASDKVIEHVDIYDLSLLTGVLNAIRPDVILNCIGITKRREEAGNPIPSIVINALFPHKLARLAFELNARLIHFSTDCVFDGMAGHYPDTAPANATDLYGRTKALGEVQGANVITLRSSFIGRELSDGTELLEWFLAQKGQVRGFRNAIYTGLTTRELSRIVINLVEKYPGATGLYNVSSEPISKFDLLTMIGKKMHPSVEVLPEESFYCDRSLDSSAFRRQFHYQTPSWEQMVDELSREKGK